MNTFKFRAHHVWFVADNKLTLASSSWWRILITLCKVWNNITATTFEEFTDSGAKGFYEMVSRKVGTVTACVLTSLIQRRCAVNWSCPVPWTSHHLLWCSSGTHPLFLCQGLTVFSFATLEVWLYLCRWNWLLLRSLLELWCGLLTQMTSVGNVPMARVAPLPTLLCELLKMPLIILWKRFLVLRGHLQVVQ